MDRQTGVADVSHVWPADLPAQWPHRAASRRVHAGGLAWHVQIFGAVGEHPDVVLLHGAGASAHSWRALAPFLAVDRRVIVPDLPGQGWTQRPPNAGGLSLPGMAGLLGALLKALGSGRVSLVGHSAGAAVAARTALDGCAQADRVLGINGAWLPPAGQGRWFYEPLARVLSLDPMLPHLLAWSARRRRAVERLVASTGSRLDEEGLACYARLVGRSAHVSAVMAMMAAWDLRPLLADLGRLPVPLRLLATEGDRTVPARASEVASLKAPDARLERWSDLGHLAHEEAPARVLAWMRGHLPA